MEITKKVTVPVDLDDLLDCFSSLGNHSQAKFFNGAAASISPVGIVDSPWLSEEAKLVICSIADLLIERRQLEPVQIYSDQGKSFVKGIDVASPLVLKQRLRVKRKGVKDLYVEVRSLKVAADGNSTDAVVDIIGEIN